ncbi:MAG: hypothetical protein EPN97_10670 [Alphaproteobacteria bacterium]|nr:MAG: hypothetical protein EPN97_10670 [Alphaproteobacteria bacterium]
MKNLFNKLARPATLVLAFAAIATTGCAVHAPRVQFTPQNVSYIQQGVEFYRTTGASPINYDACGALQQALEGNGNTGVGVIAGGAVGGLVTNAITKNPVATAAGAIGGAVAGGVVGKNAQNGNVDDLNRDCMLQQAIMRESGGTVRGGTITHQPGGIYKDEYRRRY